MSLSSINEGYTERDKYSEVGVAETAPEAARAVHLGVGESIDLPLLNSQVSLFLFPYFNPRLFFFSPPFL